jgi:hypothetical protein
VRPNSLRLAYAVDNEAGGMVLVNDGFLKRMLLNKERT